MSEIRSSAQTSSPQTDAATALWEGTDLVSQYARKDLRPVEVLVMLHHHAAFSGRVLELGCGAGRVSGYLVDLAERYVGLDVSPAMVGHCQEAYPGGEFRVGDLRELHALRDGSFDVVVATFNVLDVLEHGERGRVLDELHRICAPDGLLVFSTHNRAAPDEPPSPRRSDPLRFALDVLRLPRQLRSYRRLKAFEVHEADYAVLVDSAHGYRGLHHNVSRDAGARELADHGFRELECLDLEGAPIPTGAAAEHCSEMHYVARRT